MSNSKTTVVYLPDLVGKGYGAFWRSTKRYRVVKGGKASKKSSTTALNIIVRMMKYPQANTLVVRRVMDTHRSSTYAQLKWAIDKLGVSAAWECRVSPLEMVYRKTGQRILFRGMDDVQKLASVTVDKGVLCWVWVEEAFEISNESDFDLLDLSVPRGDVPEGYFKQTTLTFNPWHEGHWLKKRFFDHPADNVDAFTTNYLCNEFLDDNDRAIYEQMKIDNPRKYAVAGLGNWGVSEGLIFDRWRDEPFDRPDGWQWKHIFGLDYGYTNDPTAFVAAAINPIAKEIRIYDEIYQRRLLNSDIARLITEKGYAKERIRADAAEPKSNEELRRYGLTRVQAAAKGPDSIRAGIAKIQEYTIIVHPRCTNTIAELSSYCWDEKHPDRPVDRDNHLMDALRYAMEDSSFHPEEPEVVHRDWQNFDMESHDTKERGITADDFMGGWDG